MLSVVKDFSKCSILICEKEFEGFDEVKSLKR